MTLPTNAGKLAFTSSSARSLQTRSAPLQTALDGPERGRAIPRCAGTCSNRVDPRAPSPTLIKACIIHTHIKCSSTKWPKLPATPTPQDVKRLACVTHTHPRTVASYGMTGREGRRRALRRRWRGYRCQRKCARTTGSRDKAREGREEGSGRQRAGSAGNVQHVSIVFSASYRAGGVLG